MTSLMSRYGTGALTRATLLGLAGAFLAGLMVVNTVGSTDLGSSSVKLAVETFTDDPDVAITTVGVLKIPSNASAIGGSGPGVEATSAIPAVNNATTKNNYAYRFEIKESGVAAWQSGENFLVEIYGDDGSTTSLLATLYIQQSIVDDVSIEGVAVTVDVGSSTIVPDSFDIIVTRQ